MDKRVLGFLILGLGAGLMAILTMSRSGLDKLKQYEELRLKPYQDVAGKWTIGWGHLILPNEQHLMRAEGISQNVATELLKKDLQKMESAVNRLVIVPISGPQYDALVSFVFNVGVTAFRKSTLLKKLNVRDYKGAANEFPRWKFSGGKMVPGLLARREKEKLLFMAA